MLGRLGLALRRNVATMATNIAPSEPLVVVLGSTGTGKSDVRVLPPMTAPSSSSFAFI